MKVYAPVSDLEKIPNSSHSDDIGLDLVAQSKPNISGEKIKIKGVDYYSRIDYIEYDTEVKFAPEQPYYALIYPRSSISKKNLSLANSVGVIDPGYRDTIKVRFNYLIQPEDLILEKNKFYVKINEEKIYAIGDRICQLIWANENSPIVEYVDKLPPSTRGLGGFGSTGR